MCFLVHLGGINVHKFPICEESLYQKYLEEADRISSSFSLYICCTHRQLNSDLMSFSFQCKGANLIGYKLQMPSLHFSFLLSHKKTINVIKWLASIFKGFEIFKHEGSLEGRFNQHFIKSMELACLRLALSKIVRHLLLGK